jgi:hypothetical protein
MNFRNFIATQWHDIKGNAKWDIIKWTFGGCVMIPAGLAALVKFIGHAPLWEAVLVLVIGYLVAFVFFIFLICWVSKSAPSLSTVQGQQFELNQKQKSDLEVEGVPLDIASAQYHQCQIRIYNRSSTKTADNVKIELVALDDGLKNDQAAKYFRPTFPIVLKPEIAGENTINPEASIKFNLFRVTMNVRSAILKDGNIIGWEQKFLAYFTQETTKQVTQFSWKKSYRLKLVATARDFKKAEHEFDLKFTDEGTFCRFTLTKVQSQNGTLIIYSADWWIEDKHSDVTKIAQTYLVDKKTEMPCEISILGDPREGLAKVLTIDYSIGGKRSERTFREHSTISPNDLK